MLKRALLLDRDGVININHGYVYRSDDFDFIDGIFDLCRIAHKLKFEIIVITNQAGIARGFYTEQQFHELTNWMCAIFSQQGAPISKVYFSPFHPTAGLGQYKKNDISRKPNPGMVWQAENDFSLSLKHSVLVGDKPSDIEAGIAAGVGCNLLYAHEVPSGLIGTNYRRIGAVRDAIPFLIGIDQMKSGRYQ